MLISDSTGEKLTRSILSFSQLSKANLNLSFKAAPSNFKSLLTVGGRGWWKNESTWVGSYEIPKSKYDNKYFPFWNLSTATA